MAKTYAVLYGSRGVKSFNKLERAKEFAKQKATQLGKKVTIDYVMRNPNARIGESDFRQGQVSQVNPQKGAAPKPARKSAASRPRRQSLFETGLGDFNRFF